MGSRAHGASKAGIEALTRTMALDYARDTIRVNCFFPDATDTPLMWGPLPPDEFPAPPTQTDVGIPFGRIAAPVQIAQVLADLLSADAGFVIRTSIVADGGQLAKSAISI